MLYFYIGKFVSDVASLLEPIPALITDKGGSSGGWVSSPSDSYHNFITVAVENGCFEIRLICERGGTVYQGIAVKNLRS